MQDPLTNPMQTPATATREPEKAICRHAPPRIHVVDHGVGRMPDAEKPTSKRRAEPGLGLVAMTAVLLAMSAVGASRRSGAGSAPSA
eukprot:5781555-Pyramimonas_sp.AAC.1